MIVIHKIPPTFLSVYWGEGHPVPRSLREAQRLLVLGHIRIVPVSRSRRMGFDLDRERQHGCRRHAHAPRSRQ